MPVYEEDKIEEPEFEERISEEISQSLFLALNFTSDSYGLTKAEKGDLYFYIQNFKKHIESGGVGWRKVCVVICEYIINRDEREITKTLNIAISNKVKDKVLTEIEKINDKTLPYLRQYRQSQIRLRKKHSERK